MWKWLIGGIAVSLAGWLLHEIGREPISWLASLLVLLSVVLGALSIVHNLERSATELRKLNETAETIEMYLKDIRDTNIAIAQSANDVRLNTERRGMYDV